MANSLDMSSCASMPRLFEKSSFCSIAGLGLLLEQITQNR